MVVQVVASPDTLCDIVAPCRSQGVPLSLDRGSAMVFVGPRTRSVNSGPKKVPCYVSIAAAALATLLYQ